MMLLLALAAATAQPSVQPNRPPQGGGQWQGRGQGGPGGPGGPGGMAGRGPDFFFDLADANKDGQISRAEFKAAHDRMRERRQERGFGPGGGQGRPQSK